MTKCAHEAWQLRDSIEPFCNMCHCFLETSVKADLVNQGQKASQVEICDSDLGEQPLLLREPRVEVFHLLFELF